MTPSQLKSNTRKELATLAKSHNVAGWHGMRKDELIEALADVQRATLPERTQPATAAEPRPADREKPSPRATAVRAPEPVRVPDPAPRSARSVARVKPQRDDPRSEPNATTNARNGHASNGQASNGHAANGHAAKGHAIPADAAPTVSSQTGNGHANGHVGNGASSNGHAGNLRVSSAGGRTVRKDISTAGAHDATGPEELTAVAHDPHWIHARWVLKRATVQRAEAALGADWFRAVPVIRVHSLEIDEVNGVQAHWVRDVEIHGECDHWFVPVENPPGTFKLQIGYLATGGRFFALAKSRRVTTPRPGSKAAERVGWNRGPVAGPAAHRPTPSRGTGDPQFEKFLAARAVSYAVVGTDHRVRPAVNVPFTVETELVVNGTTEPNTHLTVQGEMVRVGRDGKFTLRVPLSEGRQVIPAVAVTADGTRQRTIVLAIDRNTKELEPQSLTELV